VLDLSDVTLCCVDTRSVSLALNAIQKCMAAARFGRVVFLGPDPKNIPIAPPVGVDWISIPALRGIEDYNRIMLRDLLTHVHTTHVLIVQWDGYIVHPELWRPQFLEWDYIGAPWYHGGRPGTVGNGGFSLRSVKLLKALASIELDTTRPEDMEICVHRRDELEREHTIRIAPLDAAQSFACEYGTYKPSFGFHGMHNFAYVMSSVELAGWLQQASSEIMCSTHTRKLIKSLMQVGRYKEARRLIRQRSQSIGWTADQSLLYLRALVTQSRLAVTQAPD